MIKNYLQCAPTWANKQIKQFVNEIQHDDNIQRGMRNYPVIKLMFFFYL